MRPRPDQRLRGCRQPRHHARDRVGVAVRPATDRVYRAFDRGEILADGPEPPVVVAQRMPHPNRRVQHRVLEPVTPALTPVGARQRRVRRRVGRNQEHRAPVEVFRQQAAALVVDIVGVAIVGRAHGDDRLELRWPPRRDLQRVEPAPGDTEHAHATAAPRLRFEPCKHLDDVVVLLLGVLVRHEAFGVAGAPQIEANGGITVTGHIGMQGFVTQSRKVPLAVGHALEQHRHRIGLGVVRQPDACSEPDPVAHRDPDIFDHPHRARKILDYAHINPLPSRLDVISLQAILTRTGVMHVAADQFTVTGECRSRCGNP